MDRAARTVRSLRIDFWITIGLGTLATAVVAYFARLGFHAGFVDMAHDGYQLRQAFDLARGGVIFRDTFDQYGPLGPYLNLAGFTLFGYRLLAMKWFVAGWYGLTAATLYILGRQFGAPLLAAAGVVIWLGLAPFYQHGVMLSPHAYAILFQAAAMTLLIRLRNASDDRLALIVGILSGLCVLLKQNLGTLFMAALTAYIVVSPVISSLPVKRAARQLTFLAAGAAATIGAMALWLWSRGALHDWYLQTVYFPRAFYLATDNGASVARPVTWVDLLQKFLELQGDADWYWHVLRAIVPIAAICAVMWRRTDRASLVLVALVTVCLWLAAFPSANYMHQWWTLSLTITAALYVISTVLRRLPAAVFRGDNANAALAAGVLIGIVSPGLSARSTAVTERRLALTTTIEEPWSVSGIRTDERTKTSLALLFRAMENYRRHHPGTTVLSQDESDGDRHGIAESLPLLSFWPENTHPTPIYWNLPVLSSVVYPEYRSAFQSALQHEHPLVADFRLKRAPSHPVPGYYLLATAQSREGRWMLYAPEHADAVAHGEPPVADPLPSVPPPNPDYVSLGGNGASTARAYIAPEDERFPVDDVATWISMPLGSPNFVSADLRRDGGAMSVSGDAAARYGYLLQLTPRAFRKGDYVYATGVIREGGVTLGLVEANQWVSYVNVDEPKPFAAVVVVPHDGVYALTIADYVATDIWDRVRNEGMGRAVLDSIRHRLPREVLIDRVGWTHASGREVPQ